MSAEKIRMHEQMGLNSSQAIRVTAIVNINILVKIRIIFCVSIPERD
jgi:hypothetical protein